MLKVNDRVTYAKIRATQSVEPARRNAKGTITEIDFIDGEKCARVSWDWARDAGFWVRCDLLELEDENE